MLQVPPCEIDADACNASTIALHPAHSCAQNKRKWEPLHHARSIDEGWHLTKIVCMALKNFSAKIFFVSAFSQAEVRASMPTSSIFLYCTMKCSTAPAPLGRVRKETS
jgi:hypothetical protein